MGKFNRILLAALLAYFLICISFIIYNSEDAFSVGILIYGIWLIYIPMVIVLFIFDKILFWLIERFDWLKDAVLQILLGSTIVFIYSILHLLIEELSKKGWEFSNIDSNFMESYWENFPYFLCISVVSFFIYHTVVFEKYFDKEAQE